MANKLKDAMSVAPDMKQHAASERKYRAEEALRTITRAEEFKQDRRLMGDVRKMAAKQAQCLQTVAKKK